MEVEVFQKKLAEIVTCARYNNRKLDGEFVEKFFAEEGMEAAQMEKIYEYLRAQGIHILHNGASALQSFPPQGDTLPITSALLPNLLLLPCETERPSLPL